MQLAPSTLAGASSLASHWQQALQASNNTLSCFASWLKSSYRAVPQRQPRRQPQPHRQPQRQPKLQPPPQHQHQHHVSSTQTFWSTPTTPLLNLLPTPKAPPGPPTHPPKTATGSWSRKAVPPHPVASLHPLPMINSKLITKLQVVWQRQHQRRPWSARV